MIRFNEQIIVEARAERSKKDGLGKVFELMKSLTELQKDVEECLESQESPEAVEKIRAFDGHIDEMYDILMGLAGEGVKLIRKRNDLDVEVEGLPETEGITVKKGEELLPDMVEKALPSITKPTSPSMYSM